MKPGDLVRKSKHRSDVGLILEVETNPLNFTIAKVMVCGKVENWYLENVECV